MTSLLGTIRNYTCKYVDKRKMVSIITHKDTILTVPVQVRENITTNNAIVAFVCPAQARGALKAERVRQTPGSSSAMVFDVTLGVLTDFAAEIQMPTVVMTGSAQCDLPFGSWNGRGLASYEISYIQCPPAKYSTQSYLNIRERFGEIHARQQLDTEEEDRCDEM